jgi:hypothetical protein
LVPGEDRPAARTVFALGHLVDVDPAPDVTGL